MWFEIKTLMKHIFVLLKIESGGEPFSGIPNYGTNKATKVASETAGYFF